MKLYYTSVFLCLLTVNSFGQLAFSEATSRKDSLLLQTFWNQFRQSIVSKNKAQLEDLFDFPFYCHQCVDYVQANDPSGVTVKISRTLFRDSVFQVFYDMPKLNATLWTDTVWFHRTFDDQGNIIFMILYEIVSPSKKLERPQGFIFLKKRKGKFLITGLDTVP